MRRSAVLQCPRTGLSCMDTGICDIISLDNFLQVAGIQVNCLSPREDDQVFMCTAVEEIIVSAPYMTSRGDSRAWTVYTSYTPTSKVDVANDIFVCDSSSGKLVLAIMGANFKSIPFKSVAISLTRLNKTSAMSTAIPALQSGDSDDVHDSAYQTRFPSPSGDGLQKELSKDTLHFPERQATVIASASQTATAHQQQPEQATTPSSIVQSVRSMFSAILEYPSTRSSPRRLWMTSASTHC